MVERTESKSFARIRKPSDGIAPIGDPKACLEPEEFTPFVRETIAPGRRKTIISHIATCKSCRSLIATVRREEYPNGMPRDRKRLMLTILGLLAAVSLYSFPNLFVQLMRSGTAKPTPFVLPPMIVDEASFRDEVERVVLELDLKIDNESFRPYTLVELRKLAEESHRNAVAGPRIRPCGRLLDRRPTITIDRLDIGVAAKVALIDADGDRVVAWNVDPNADRASADRVTIPWPPGYAELEPGSTFRIVAEIGDGPEKFEVASNVATLDLVACQVIPIIMQFPYGLIREELRPLVEAQVLMRHGLFADALPLAEEAALLHDTSEYVRAMLDAIATHQGVEMR